jgi:hypothetical protein
VLQEGSAQKIEERTFGIIRFHGIEYHGRLSCALAFILSGRERCVIGEKTNLWTEEKPVMTVFLPVHDSIDDLLISPAKMLRPQLVVGMWIWLHGWHWRCVGGEFESRIVAWCESVFNLRK